MIERSYIDQLGNSRKLEIPEQVVQRLFLTKELWPIFQKS